MTPYQRAAYARGLGYEPEKEEFGQGFQIFGDGKRVPTLKERQDIFSKGGVTINLDSNWGPSSSNGVTSPMVVIPNRATPEQRTASENYARRVAELYNNKFGTNLKHRVVTRAENGRGRPATIHTEPYALTDKRAVEYFNSDEGRREYDKILTSTLGTIPGAQFSLPHNPAKGDNGAYGSGTNEVDRARGIIGRLGVKPPTTQPPQQIVYGQEGLYQSQPQQSQMPSPDIAYKAPSSGVYPYSNQTETYTGQPTSSPPAPTQVASYQQQAQKQYNMPPLPGRNPNRPTGATWVTGSDGMNPLFASDATPQQLKEHFPQGGSAPKFGSMFKGLFK